MSDYPRYYIKALSGVAHGGFEPSDGSNHTEIRRESLAIKRDEAPAQVDIPVIGANAVKGLCRRKTMRATFESMGIRAGDFDGSDAEKALYQCTYALLANGGNGQPGPEIKPERMREVRAHLPALSVFGTAAYRNMIPGRFEHFGHAYLRCREGVEARLVTPDGPMKDAESFVDDGGMARHIERDHNDPDISQVGPMVMTLEYVIGGSDFEGIILFEDETTELERSAFAFGLSRVRVVGGNGARGFGLIETVYDGDPEPYREWLQTQAHKEKDFLFDFIREVMCVKSRDKLKAKKAKGKGRGKKKEEAA